MKQFFELKAKHPDAIMLFRCGDFYETYSEDAIVASEILGITLTKRANGQAKSVEMAGFPFHALDTYLPKLVRAGKRVAICDQLEDPKMTKKLVKRGITELVTPGVAINDNVLSYKENNFLAAVHFGKASCGVAFLDISTGEFLTAEGPFDYIEQNDYLTLSFLGEEHKEVHKICGSKSGRDMDKVKATGLSPLFTENGSITFEQARLTFECKKLYADLIKPGNFIDKSITDRWYGESHGGFHKMYVVEIVNVLSR
jgi:hypothetical protein